MSNVYVQEPVTKGKVCLKTTVGDIDVELWSKECPKACRNFVQLCLEGYYDELTFHRLVKDFIVQSGDPSGTGLGGDSVYGAPFKDEVHSRLRFTRRGLVGCANAGTKNDNNSQFFFTLGPTPELQGKHTLFGRVVGSTLFNMLKLGEGDVDQNERPALLRKIIGAEVIVNPFDDIVPRKLAKRTDDKDKKPESKSKATKNFGLLSFGDEAEEEEETAIQVTKKLGKGSKSAHDILDDDPALSKAAAVTEEELGQSKEDDEEEASVDPGEKREMLERIRSKLATTGGGKGKKGRQAEEEEDEDLDGIIDDSARAADKAKKDAVRAEIRSLQKQMVKELRGVEEKEEEEEQEELSEALNMYRKDKKKYMEAKESMPKPKSYDRELQTLEMLGRFKSKLSSVQAEKPSPPSEEDIKKKRRRLGKEYEEEVKEDEEEVVGDDWMANRFETDVEELRRAKDANVKDMDTYDIYDPRNPLNKRRREGQKTAQKVQDKRMRDMAQNK